MKHSIEPTSRTKALGKLVVLLSFGAVCGYFYHVDVLTRNLRAAALPAEQAPDCPLVSGALVEHTWPYWGDMTLFVVMVLVFFGLYELVGAGAGRLVGFLLRLGHGQAGQSRA